MDPKVYVLTAKDLDSLKNAWTEEVLQHSKEREAFSREFGEFCKSETPWTRLKAHVESQHAHQRLSTYDKHKMMNCISAVIRLSFDIPHVSRLKWKQLEKAREIATMVLQCLAYARS
ncbi:hypothetical protein [Paenibacillus woosongensis]|uniref:Uncharacterized protein n=1 Tax=Paenibacillus woosongensis TaxID=307580 RepID=A0ABQ4MPE5_9BACL|nr:hypothetical protein [Paenibacillus woosongensis]GIP57874.1 hypothetical protein J15TS10_16880 [Paenibacillus woosongensis]